LDSALLRLGLQLCLLQLTGKLVLLLERFFFFLFGFELCR
jgi:hypothetical protein